MFPPSPPHAGVASSWKQDLTSSGVERVRRSIPPSTTARQFCEICEICEIRAIGAISHFPHRHQFRASATSTIRPRRNVVASLCGTTHRTDRRCPLLLYSPLRFFFFSFCFFCFFFVLCSSSNLLCLVVSKSDQKSLAHLASSGHNRQTISTINQTARERTKTSQSATNTPRFFSEIRSRIWATRPVKTKSKCRVCDAGRQPSKARSVCVRERLCVCLYFSIIAHASDQQLGSQKMKRKSLMGGEPDSGSRRRVWSAYKNIAIFSPVLLECSIPSPSLQLSGPILEAQPIEIQDAAHQAPLTSAV